MTKKTKIIASTIISTFLFAALPSTASAGRYDRGGGLFGKAAKAFGENRTQKRAVETRIQGQTSCAPENTYELNPETGKVRNPRHSNGCLKKIVNGTENFHSAYTRILIDAAPRRGKREFAATLKSKLRSCGDLPRLDIDFRSQFNPRAALNAAEKTLSCLNSIKYDMEQRSIRGRELNYTVNGLREETREIKRNVERAMRR